MTAPETWTRKPARNYSWPQAQPGNTLSLRHGARSRRVYEPIAADLVAGLLEERPDLEDYPDATVQWAEAEARAELLRKWVAERGVFDDEDVPRSGALTWLRVFENQAQEARKTLGLDPRSHAELVRTRHDALRGSLISKAWPPVAGKLASQPRSATPSAKVPPARRLSVTPVRRRGRAGVVLAAPVLPTQRHEHEAPHRLPRSARPPGTPGTAPFRFRYAKGSPRSATAPRRGARTPCARRPGPRRGRCPPEHPQPRTAYVSLVPRPAVPTVWSLYWRCSGPHP